MRRIHRVAVLSNASFAPIDPLRHPPESVSVHSRNDSGDTGGRGQGLVMDRLVADDDDILCRLEEELINLDEYPLVIFRV